MALANHAALSASPCTPRHLHIQDLGNAVSKDSARARTHPLSTKSSTGTRIL